MNLDDIDLKGFILALFIRDDGERFLLGSGYYEFDEKQIHFKANEFENDIVEVQGNDGLLLAGQVRRATAQPFDGYVGDNTVSRATIETKRREFLAFFRKNYYYTVVYIFYDGTAIQRKKGFIVEAPEVEEIYQFMPKYHISINFEDVNYYAYAEDSAGDELYGKSAVIPLTGGVNDGGLVWDNIGVVFDNIGSEWDAGSGGGPTTVQVSSIDLVYPVWEVIGPANNPRISVVNTNTTLYYTGNISVGQTLKINMFDKTAFLDNTSVINSVSGEWVYFEPGSNRVVYATDNNDAEASTIYWQEVVG